MVTYFNKKDLVDFGKYLFSEKRRKSFELTESEIPIEDRLKLIHKEDIDNFIDSNKKIECSLKEKVKSFTFFPQGTEIIK